MDEALSCGGIYYRIGSGQSNSCNVDPTTFPGGLFWIGLVVGLAGLAFWKTGGTARSKPFFPPPRQETRIVGQLESESDEGKKQESLDKFEKDETG